MDKMKWVQINTKHKLTWAGKHFRNIILCMFGMFTMYNAFDPRPCPSWCAMHWQCLFISRLCQHDGLLMTYYPSSSYGWSFSASASPWPLEICVSKKSLFGLHNLMKICVGKKWIWLNLIQGRRFRTRHTFLKLRAIDMFDLLKNMLNFVKQYVLICLWGHCALILVWSTGSPLSGPDLVRHLRAEAIRLSHGSLAQRWSTAAPSLGGCGSCASWVLHSLA